MDYKDSLLLPNTKFPMRGNLPQNEPKKYKLWDDEKVYDRMKSNREGAPSFTLHDGPPYANGHIHIGHALNKVLKGNTWLLWFLKLKTSFTKLSKY